MSDLQVHLISYADERFRNAQDFQNTIASRLLGFKSVRSYSNHEISMEFWENNLEIFRVKKGAGLWLWKPYFIDLDLFSNVLPGDWLFYCDSGAFPIVTAKNILSMLVNVKQDIVAFELPVIERQFTHQLCFNNVAKGNVSLRESNMISASYMFIKNTEFSRRVVKSWLAYCCNINNLSDTERKIESDFQGHRHDQSIWSLVLKLNKIDPYFDIGQFRETPEVYSNDRKFRLNASKSEGADSNGRIIRKSMAPKFSKSALVFHHRSDKPLLSFFKHKLKPKFMKI